MRVQPKNIVFCGLAAALYAALTLALAPLGFGPVQFRLAEALCILPFFVPVSVWGLFIGCLVVNLVSPYGPLDVIFGSAASLLAGTCTMLIGKTGRSGVVTKALACLPPVLFNGLIVGAVIAWTEAPRAFWAAFAVNAGQIAFGEFAVLFALGLPMMIYLPKTAFFKGILAYRDQSKGGGL